MQHLRFPLLSHALILAVSAATLPAPSVAAQAVQARSALATTEQIDAEKLTLRILKRPEIIAARAQVAEQLQTDPATKNPDGQRLLVNALDHWLVGLVLRETRGDPSRPAFVWAPEPTPRNWHGHVFPGSGLAGDNPDNIYRVASIDSRYGYEIVISPSPNGPAQFSVEASRGAAGRYGNATAGQKQADMGNQIKMLKDSDLAAGADGRITITLDTKPAGDRKNHIQLPEGSAMVMFRNSLSDWRQSPQAVSIRRTDALPTPPAQTEAQIASQVARDIGPWVKLWSDFKEGWLGGTPVNALVGPLPRDGGWGYLAAGRFALADDEAIVATLGDGGAVYTGFQILDPWMIAPDSTRNLTSRNNSQVTPNADGSITYVVAARDPGSANWIDTAGLHHGFVNIRWQKLAPGASGDGLLRDYRVVKIADLASLRPAGAPAVTTAQREAELAKHAASYELRLNR